MSFSSLHSLKYTNLYAQLLKDLETSGVINRSVEFLPDDKKIQERQSSGVGFTRPELAALLAYSKIHIKNEILKSNIPEDSYFNEILKSAFPSALHKKYSKQLEEHSLKREIIATQLSNQIVNMMGITFIYRLQVETGASIAEIVRAYTIASHIYKAHELEQLALKLDFKIPVSTQYTLLHNIRRLLNLSTRWFLYNDRSKGDLKEIINHYALAIQKVGKTVPNLMTGITKEYLIKNTNELVGMGLERNIAERFALLRGMYTVLNVIEVAKQHHLDLIHSSNVYFNVGNYFNFVWFRDQIINDSREGHWNTLARLSLRDELDLLQRKIALIIIKDNKKEKDSIKLIEKWRLNHKSIIEKWERIFQLVCSSANVDYVMFFVALRELANLIQERK